MVSCQRADGQRPGPWKAVREKQAIVDGAFHAPAEAATDVTPDCSSGDCS